MRQLFLNGKRKTHRQARTPAQCHDRFGFFQAQNFLHILNTAPERAWVAEPMPAILGHWWGADLDLSHYEQEGHAYDSAFSVDRVFEQLGFRARVLP